jgi:hypothetical protein
LKRPLLFFIVLFVFAFGNVTRATTYTWNGGTSGAWNIPTNWLPSTGYPGMAAADIAIINTTGANITYTGAYNFTKIQTTANSAYNIVLIGGNSTSALNISGGITLVQPATFTNVLIFSTNGTTTISGTASIGYKASIKVSSGATLSVNGISLDITTTQATITNDGTLNFLSGSTLKLGDATGLTNTGTLTATSTTFSIPGQGSIQNTAGTFAATSCTFTLGGQPSSIQNSGTGNFIISGGSVALPQGAYIANAGSGSFTLSGGVTVTESGGGNTYISNSGTFYAGTSGSICTITCSNQPSNITTKANVYNSSTFYLGPASSINFTSGVYHQTICNVGTFTLQSDATGSATIGAIDGSSGVVQSVVGTYNVERFLTGGNVKYRSYRLLSSPVNISSSTTGSGNIDLSYVNTTVGTNYGALTAGPGGTGSGFTVPNNNPTLYLYNESLASNNSSFTSGKNVGIVNVSAGTVTTLSAGVTSPPGKTIPVGNGFMFYFIGDNHTPYVTASNRVPENTTITAIGTINQQDVPVKLWNSPASTSLVATNNLVGNPYPSTINLKQVYLDNYNSTTNPIGSIFYQLSNVNPAQAYISYNAPASMSSNGTPPYVVSGQGFFATVTATGRTITFKEGQKISNQVTGTALLMSTPENKTTTNSLTISTSADIASSSFAMQQDNNMPPGLHLAMVQDTVVYDACGIYFTKDGIDKYDSNDAIDLDGISPKAYLSSYTIDGKRTGINSLSSYAKGKKVKLYVKATTDGVYKLNLTDIQNIDITNYNLYLKDHYAKDSLDLNHNSSYSFRIQNSDTTTFGANRFELVITPKPMPPYALTSFTAKKVNEGVLLTWQTANEGNYTGFTLEKQNSSQFTALNNLQSNGAGTYTYIDHNPTTGTNAYRLMQSGLEANISYSETISVLYNTNSLNLYPNPAKDDINIYVNAPTTDNNPAYQMSIYDSSGTLILTKQINKAYTQNVATLRIGTYIVQVTDNNGKLIGNNKFSKIQ